MQDDYTEEELDQMEAVAKIFSGVFLLGVAIVLFIFGLGL